MGSMVSAVVFDVGETLLDDSREWRAWADWVGVSPHTFSTVLGAVTAAGRDNAETFEYFRPGFDLARERQLREEAGCGEQIDDSYVGTSGEWGVAKPDPGFFRRVVDVVHGPADQIVYVGDHRDNDVLPAKAAGLRVALIRRGPWGYLWADDPVARENADWVIDSLAELPALLLDQ
jgi:FMN phosphatase YigB (HAD superfamily)